MEALINAVVFAGLVAIFGAVIQLLHVMIENPVAGLLVVVCAVTATAYLTFR